MSIFTPDALALIERWVGNWEINVRGPHWPFTRAQVGASLKSRVKNPAIIDQGVALLCGPAAFLFNIASSDPLGYVQFVTSLFDMGCGNLRNLVVRAPEGSKAYHPKGIDPADWIAMASLRNSENWLLTYNHVGHDLSSGTLAGEMADWYRRAGYTNVIDRTYLNVGKPDQNLGTIGIYPQLIEQWQTDQVTHIREASVLRSRGSLITLFINSCLLKERKFALDIAFGVPNHWVVLLSPVRTTATQVTFELYSYGEHLTNAPLKLNATFELNRFCENYFGYIACKY